ncbi:MAG: hypothetical protein ABIY55_30195 [Kofleriaceae bacterium]
MGRGSVLALACVTAVGCGRVGFTSERVGDAAVVDATADAPSDAPADAALDAARAPLTLDPGFPIVVELDATPGTMIATPTFTTPGPNRLLVGVFAARA